MSQLPPKSSVPRSTSVREDRHSQRSAAAQFRLDRSRSVYADSSEVGAKGSISALMDRDLRSSTIAEKDSVLPMPIPHPNPNPNMIPPARPGSTRRDHQPLWTNIPGLRSFSTRWADPAPPRPPIQVTESTEVMEDGKKVPLWKQLLRKFRREARRRKKSSTTMTKNNQNCTTNGSKASISIPPSSTAHVLPSLAERPEDAVETALSNGDKQQQKRPAVYPEPLLVRHTSTSTPSSCSPSPSSSQTTPIWERRSILQPLPLDLSKLRVTGMGRLPRTKVVH